MLLMSFNEGALGNLVEHALASLASMMLESPSLIVQFTQGMFPVPPTLIQMLPCLGYVWFSVANACLGLKICLHKRNSIVNLDSNVLLQSFN